MQYWLGGARDWNRFGDQGSATMVGDYPLFSLIRVLVSASFAQSPGPGEKLSLLRPLPIIIRGIYKGY
jgi:hypothetical protein